MVTQSPLRLQSLGDLRLFGPAGDLLRHRRKELGLLVLLAARAPRAVRREEIQAMLWGERDEKRARHSLRQALLRIRQACGDQVLDVAADTLKLVSNRIVLDAREFTDAAAAHRFRDAIELWTGDFLVGCEDIGGEDFLTWFDGERARLRRILYSCFEQAVSACQAGSDWTEMVRWSAQWRERFSADEAAAERHIEALCACGKTAEARMERSAFIHHLAADIGDDPSPQWLAATTRHIDDAPGYIPAALVVEAEPKRVPASRSTTRSWRTRATAACLAAAVLATVAWRLQLLDALRPQPTVLAVGHIGILGMPDSAAALPSLLAINLGRANDLVILSEGRVEEVRVQMQSRGNVAGDLQRAARAAGANQVIEGIVARRPDGSLRLDLQRIDLASHKTRATYSVEGKDLFALVDAAAERIARDFGAELSSDRLAGTTSLSATRLYEEGLRSYYGGELSTAGRLFRLALREDSTFAMAAYYAARVPGVLNANDLLRHARRMAQRGSDRDRLFIEAFWMGSRDDPNQLAVAETLAIRYPAEPAAHFAYGKALVRTGRFHEAIPQYQRVIEMDSLGLRGEQPRCLGCEAYFAQIDAYRFADSMSAAERIAREWVTRQPRSSAAWQTLSGMHKSQGRYKLAIDEVATSARFDHTNNLATVGMMDLWLRQGDFASADRFWSGLLATPGHDLRASALGDAISSLRMQGRLAEALNAAIALRSLAAARGDPFGDAFLHAYILFDLGRYRESAALYDSISRPNPEDSEARQGRNRAWFLTHAATALAALRDTAQLRVLEDTIRVNGARSGFRRDQLLHLYVRGLRFRLQGNQMAAIAAFRRSQYSPVEGNTRATLELARTLLDTNQPGEALRVLRAAHWGPIGATGQYINRTELELLMARSFEAAHQPDSAAAHYSWVLHALRHADPTFLSQRNQVQERMRHLPIN